MNGGECHFTHISSGSVPLCSPQVESYADRVVLYVLSQVLFQQEDVTQGQDDQVTFLCPGPSEVGKILWRGGEAAAFYTLKPKGEFIYHLFSHAVVNIKTEMGYVYPCLLPVP